MPICNIESGFVVLILNIAVCCVPIISCPSAVNPTLLQNKFSMTSGRIVLSCNHSSCLCDSNSFKPKKMNYQYLSTSYSFTLPKGGIPLTCPSPICNIESVDYSSHANAAGEAVIGKKKLLIIVGDGAPWLTRLLYWLIIWLDPFKSGRSLVRYNFGILWKGVVIELILSLQRHQDRP